MDEQFIIGVEVSLDDIDFLLYGLSDFHYLLLCTPACYRVLMYSVYA